MRIITVVAVVVLSLLCCGNARANATSGEELLQKCKTESANYGSGFCHGFIAAVLDTLTMWEASDSYEKRTHDKDVRFCLPAEVTNGQIVLVFVKYLEDHPEKLHMPANLLLVEALRKAFPCKAP
jgi:Rap1a immunity proteins